MLPFATPSGSIDVKTMHLGFGMDFDYFKGDRYQAVDIPFDSRGCDYNWFCMRIILPDEGYQIKDVLGNLADQKVKPIKRNFRIDLPKFQIRYRIENLEKILKAAGVRLLFNNPYTLSDISSSTDIFRDMELCQETALVCDEYGTKVAAVTGLGYAWSNGEPIEFHSFKVDRPFIFLIVEKRSGAIMFEGVVNDPRE